MDVNSTLFCKSLNNANRRGRRPWRKDTFISKISEFVMGGGSGTNFPWKWGTLVLTYFRHHQAHNNYTAAIWSSKEKVNLKLFALQSG